MTTRFSAIRLTLNAVELIQDTVDPSAGGGVAAPVGSFYLRSGTGQAWLKTGAGDTAWTQLATGSPQGGEAFGAGTDGNVTIAAGTTTLTRSMFYNNLTIDAGGILKPDGFQIFVASTLAWNGEINADGSIGAAGAAGGAGGNAAWQTSGRVLPGSHQGGAGGGFTGGTAGANATDTPDASVYSGTGGNGGDGITVGGRGAGGTCTPTAAVHGGMPYYQCAVNGRYPDNSVWSVGPGGGGGGGAGGAGNTGGGGGGGGGYPVVCARILAGSGGFLRARGGGGGAGGTGGTGPTGGGGGGMGGISVLVYQSGSLPTIQVTGGAGGAQFGGGANGSNGSDGRSLVFQI